MNPIRFFVLGDAPETILTLCRRLAARPEVGLIQTLPTLIRGGTLFARLGRSGSIINALYKAVVVATVLAGDAPGQSTTLYWYTAGPDECVKLTDTNGRTLFKLTSSESCGGPPCIVLLPGHTASVLEKTRRVHALGPEVFRLHDVTVTVDDHSVLRHGSPSAR